MRATPRWPARASLCSPALFWHHDLAEGHLVRPFDQVSTRGYAYWLVYSDHRRTVPKIKRFREWLRGEVERDLAGV